MNKFQQKQAQTQSQASQGHQFEKTVAFSHAHAIIWQIKFSLNGVTNKKSMQSFLTELTNVNHDKFTDVQLSECFGKDFDKYLLKELIEQIDLKDPTKPQKDKTEQFKSQILSQEISRISQKPEFLHYFYEIATHSFHDRLGDFLQELSKRLKLGVQTQLLIALSLVESCRGESLSDGKIRKIHSVALKLLKNKLVEFQSQAKQESLPEYAVNRIIYHCLNQPELKNEENIREIMIQLIQANMQKIQSHISLRATLCQDTMDANINPDDPSISMLKDGSGLENLDKSTKMLEPWQILLDLGHFATYNYNYLLTVFQDYKDLNEIVMARTLLYLSQNHQCTEDQNQRIVQYLFESNKKGQFQDKEITDKKTSMQWNFDHLSRLFRELYPKLNWLKVFEALSEVNDEEVVLDAKSFQTFLSLFQKCSPQNLLFPLNVVIERKWINPALQFNFIENCVHFYVEKKDKQIGFQKLNKKQEDVPELQGVKDKIQPELIHVWQSVDLVERLIELSSTPLFHKIRLIFEQPLKQVPEYLLLTLSLTKPESGNLMLDELLSLLLPQFLGNHINSIPVLQHLWKNNQPLMIRGICELCRHDQRIMNLSRVLDITQEVRDSLIPIVDCEDYFFAVNLGILAGKRDFLHYDVWLASRIKEVGTPFIKALLKYIKEHIINPITEYINRNQTQSSSFTQDQLENFKQQVLERSHLSKEKLCLTLEHLQNPMNKQNPMIKPETIERINDVLVKTTEYFPILLQPGQNSEQIDNAANDYFQRVFSAEPAEVDQKIAELIVIMQNFKKSEVRTEQEIYACMLHSLFDEYRFLHRYPPQYLEKISKLFGQIIKNQIIEGTLLDIAIKFAFEAFKREGRRQKFGIIAIKQFFDQLPQFPSFFKDLYEIRHNLQSSDPQMMKDLEALYEKTLQEQALQKQEEAKQQTRQVESKQTAEEKKAQQEAKEEAASKVGGSGINKINTAEFMQIFNTIESQTQSAQPPIIQQQQTAAQQQPKQMQQQVKQTQQVNPPSFVPDQSLVQRTSTPLSNLQVQQTRSEQQTQLNVQAAAFNLRRGPTSSVPIQQPPQQQQPSNLGGQGIQYNLNVLSFRPTQIKSPIQLTAQQQQIMMMQNMFEQRIQKALDEDQKIRLEDLIEDQNIIGPQLNVQEQIKFICNNTGKNNFNQKLEELKQLIGPNNLSNLQWFINYILTKRISNLSGNLHHIYIEMIKQIGMKQSVECTVLQAVESFKKCLVIDENAFLKVAQKAAQQSSPIKTYLISLGSFLGALTLGSNRPILQKELDIKQLLIEGFQNQDKLKFIVIFVCRILKECTRSSVFKVQNPWVASILSLLREIKESVPSTKINEQSQGDILNEIETTFRAFSIQQPPTDIPSFGILKALQTQQYSSSSQQIELNYLLNKGKFLPSVPPPSAQLSALQNRNQSPAPQTFMKPQDMPSQMPYRMVNPSGADLLSENFLMPSTGAPSIATDYPISTQINERVTVSSEIFQLINKHVAQTEAQIRKMLGEAVDASIVEILPPVVDRSVTIALITTRELVIKDFAFDGDHEKILTAADLIVKNLAGSLALVTCREPLKMSLTTNLRKALTQLNLTAQTEVISETAINEIAQLASKENLELGCKLIKKAVIEKAQKKVKEDPAIVKAIELRKRFVELGMPFFRDENIIKQFSELPPQLQPNPTGLTKAQFQVYEDFSKLSLSGTQRQTGASQPEQNDPLMQQPSQTMKQFNQLPQDKTLAQNTDIEQILKTIEIQGIQEPLKRTLQLKLAQMSAEPNQEDQIKLWTFVKKWFHAACNQISSKNIQELTLLLEALSCVVLNYKAEDFSKKLTHEFLGLNEILINNVELNIILMRYQIISISEWDIQLAIFLKESASQGSLSENVLQFISDFLTTSIQTQKLLSYTQLPNLMTIIKNITPTFNLQQYFGQILEDFKQKAPLNRQSLLREYFKEWVGMSYGESTPNQEQDINRFFTEFTKMEFFKDNENMQIFCKVMVDTCIEKALHDNEGNKRPSDRLDYRYIESFIKLLIVLMKTQTFNKHTFMNKVFESIQETLGEDHKQNKTEFNQKPYYRMLMNILTAINLSQCFNAQTQQYILLSMAEMFKNLNPNKYPAFAFSWIELVSHKQFMPHFIKSSLQGQNLEQNQLPQGIMGKKGGISGQSFDQMSTDNNYSNKYNAFKDLLINLFTFLKMNMPGTQQVPQCMKVFYEATLRMCLVILHDFPDFFSDFHFILVNSLPDHCIQLRNIILSAYPSHIQPPNPFTKHLKVDLLTDIKVYPKICDQFNNYIELMNLREDLDTYFRTKNPQIIQIICEKMCQSEEIINGRRKIHSNVINAVVLYIAKQSNGKSPQGEMNQKESMDLFKQIALKLNNETRWSLLNSIVNELRYPNSLTYYFSCIILYLFAESGQESIQEQISRILFERISVNKPHPWGLMISFRELIQNPKYGFMQKPFIQQNMSQVEALFEGKLSHFKQFLAKPTQRQGQFGQQQFIGNQEQINQQYQ